MTASARESITLGTTEAPGLSLAAQMGNDFVEQADRGLLTEQLARAEADLAHAEGAIRLFQGQNRTIVLAEQARGAIVSAARLKAEVIAAEVQIHVTRSFAAEANPEIIALRRRIREMNRQLVEAEYRDGTEGRAAGARRPGDFSLPLAQVPEVGLELTRLTCEVEVRGTLVRLPAQQLERVKIAEASDRPLVLVQDVAVPTRRPSTPRLERDIARGLITESLAGGHVGPILRVPAAAPGP